MKSTRNLLTLPAYVVSMGKGTYKDAQSNPGFSLNIRKEIDFSNDTGPAEFRLADAAGAGLSKDNL